MCLVPNFSNHWTTSAPSMWADAGFTGAVTFDPPVPPRYKIAWQSLAAGSQAPCTSGITVRKAAP